MKIKVSAHPLDFEERKAFGVFISHSNDSDIFKEVCKALEDADVPHLVDKQIKVSAMDFASEIKLLIDKCKLAIVVITEGALQSSWVNFEIGMLCGEGKRILLYDPMHLLSIGGNYHLDKFPVYDNIISLVSVCKEIGFFEGIFQNYTKELTKELFEQRVNDYTVPVRITFTLPGYNDLHLEKTSFSLLLLNFGVFDCKYGDEGLCFQTFEEEKVCPVSKMPCALNNNPNIKEYPECVLLNKTLDANVVNQDDVTVVLPVHKIYGTRFKMFADICDSKETDKLFELLEALSLTPSKSKSGNGQRIYFNLPNSNWDGIFKLKNTFSDNFICPSVVEVE
ncbi:MAG: toll/interleukin-1 receptor domain-containing protein [Anaeroplasmataceae bacterium]